MACDNSSTERPLFAPGAEEYYRKVLGLEPKPAKCGYNEHPFNPIQGYKDEPGKPHCLTCGHAEGVCDEHSVPETEPQCPSACSEGHTYSGSCMERAKGPCDCSSRFSNDPATHAASCRTQHEPEPPLTPEEEEQAPEDQEVQCWHTGPYSPCDWNICRQKPEAPEDEDEGLSGPCDCGEGAVHYTAADCPFEQRRMTQELPPPEGPEYTPCVCGHIVPEHTVTDGQICMKDDCGCVAYRTEPDFVLQPQPDRRPPMLVAYSVQGHLYEVALSGDATVQAVDGALVITHGLGPVAGIVQIMPAPKEGPDGSA